MIPKITKGCAGPRAWPWSINHSVKTVDQQTIFYKIAVAGDKKGSYSVCSHHLMCRDAINRGFYALSIYVKKPEEFLISYEKKTIDNSIRIIFSQRPKNTSTDWHATVLVDIIDSDVVVHDPWVKPSRRIARQTFMELWRGGIKPDEYGNRLIAVSDKKSARNKCFLCGKRIPDSIKCPACHKTICLEPKDVLGCIDDHCSQRLWKIIGCPYCDNTIYEI